GVGIDGGFGMREFAPDLAVDPSCDAPTFERRRAHRLGADDAANTGCGQECTDGFGDRATAGDGNTGAQTAGHDVIGTLSLPVGVPDGGSLDGQAIAEVVAGISPHGRGDAGVIQAAGTGDGPEQAARLRAAESLGFGPGKGLIQGPLALQGEQPGDQLVVDVVHLNSPYAVADNDG
ncbi:MAG: hypothetical protein VW362_12620, partial [Candidatus Nanopelagicales bacterium]